MRHSPTMPVLRFRMRGGVPPWRNVRAATSGLGSYRSQNVHEALERTRATGPSAANVHVTGMAAGCNANPATDAISEDDGHYAPAIFDEIRRRAGQ